MTDLEILRTLTGEENEGLLTVLLQEAEERILTETRRTVMIQPLRSAVRSWAVIAYNRMGMEGEISRSEAGISSSFAEIPKDVQDAIMNYRLARAGGKAYEAEQEAETDEDETQP
jgi:hypothetical protein